MKTNYIAPKIEVLEIELEDDIMSWSSNAPNATTVSNSSTTRSEQSSWTTNSMDNYNWK